MKNPSKIIPFQFPKARFIRSDDQSRRVIVGIGRQRIALDFSTRITELPPATGNQPVPSLLLEEQQSGMVHRPRNNDNLRSPKWEPQRSFLLIIRTGK
jgi:hypothetical protein